MQRADRAQFVKDLAVSVGFDRCGIARAGPIGRGPYLRTWLENGRAGSMAYLGRHLECRLDPASLLDGARSIIMVALLYRQEPPPRIPSTAGPRGQVAMYAWGDDYHGIVKAKLSAMLDQMRAELDQPFEVRACVDTAPLLEREWAAAAGIGWIGKNTMLLDHKLGSYFFLGGLVTTLDLPPDDPLPDRCGTCTACLDACPTHALAAPYEMDASRCISYLTIEHRGDIPASLASNMGNWVFGCDVCQQVCPHNRQAPLSREPGFAIRPPAPAPLLEDLLSWSIEDYRNQLRGSAMKRAKLEMLKRNCTIARANAERK